jgi:HlyD family secretion protein
VYGKGIYMTKLLKKIFKSKIFYFIIILTIVLIAGIRYISERKKTSTLITFEVIKRDMTISVLEGGSLVAMESQKIINNVPGTRTVLEAVEDGTRITEEDVENGLVLLRMDSKDLEDRRENLILDVENSRDAYMEAEQRLEIQKKQNESDLTQAELKVKFAQMDLKKYLGDALAEELIKNEKIDIPYLLENEKLAGEALNKKRQLTNNIDIAKEQVTRAEDKVNWSKKLAEKGYITESELEADILSLKQREVAMEQAELEYRLFLDYDFAKEVEKYLSDYQESLRELERVKANCEAKMIQARSSLQSRKAAHTLKKNSLAEIHENIENCTVKATRPGVVTTPSGGRRWRIQEPIQPGTSVRMRQELFLIPDFRKMGVEVNVHESSVRKLSPGQKATIKVDAFPDVPITGKVKRIAHMPDPTLQFRNPDLNVYITRVAFDKSYDYLKPGMSAQVEIFIKELKDIIAIPIDAVLFKEDKPHCIILENNKVREREIDIGESSETLVEVKNGLAEGETIVMQPRMVASQIKKTEIEERGVFKDEETGQEQTYDDYNKPQETSQQNFQPPAGITPEQPVTERSTPTQKQGKKQRQIQ